MRALKKVLGYIRKADLDYHLIDENDHIVVGVSGGKDSLTLLYALGLYRKYADKQFRLSGIFIDVGFSQTGFEEVESFFRDLNIPVYKVETRIREILEQHLHHDTYNCYTCSKLKKGALIQEAKKINANKIALGHHIDDAIETLFLNEIYAGKMETMPFKRYFDREDITTIRPLLYLEEKEIVACCKELNLPIMKSNCPKDGTSKRQDIKDLLNSIYEKYPDSKNNFKNMIQKPEHVVLWKKEK